MIYSGSLVLLYLKIKDNWQEIGGMRSIKMLLSNQQVDVSNVASGKWQELLDQAGLSKVHIDGSGAFLNSYAEQIIQRLAFRSKLAEYKLVFANGDHLIGNFQIIRYERLGEVEEEECYVIALTSSGKVEYSF